MTSPTDHAEENRSVANAVEGAIRIAAIGILAFAAYSIVLPFVVPLVWGAIIAIALHPAFVRLVRVSGGRRGLAATILTLLLILALLIPTVLLTETLVTGIRGLAESLRQGSPMIPPPPAGVESWPIIGKQVAGLWTLASVNLEKAVVQLGPHLRNVGGWLLSVAGDLGMALVLLVVSMIVSGILLAYSEAAGRGAHRLANRLMGERGAEFVLVAESTVRSVAMGILGVAVIQAFLAGLGLLVAGIPLAGFWAFLCLILSVIQVGPILILLPSAIYLFATADTLTAVLFSIWALIVVVSDNILKPFLLGRGVDTPMLVVLMGSIGGLITAGVVGLFVGAVILTLFYKLFLAWLEQPSGG